MQGLEEIQQIAQAAASYYVRALRWSEPAELVQEAALAVLRARATYQRKRGTSFWTYAYCAALYALRRYTWRTQNPVSTPQPYHGGQLTFAVPLEMTGGEVLEGLPVDVLADAEIRTRARAAFRACDTSRKKLGIRVSLDGLQPAEVARIEGVPVEQVYHAAKNLRRNAKRSPVLRSLYEEIRT